MKRALSLALRTAVLLILIALIAFAILALQIDRLGGRDDARRSVRRRRMRSSYWARGSTRTAALAPT